MSTNTQFFDDLSRAHRQAWNVLHTVRPIELSLPKAFGITEPLDEFGTISVVISDASGSTISSILIGLERLVADALAERALTDGRFQSVLDLPFVPDISHRGNLATILRSEINIVVVEASTNSPFEFVAKVFATPRVKRWIKDWGVKPIITQLIVNAMLGLGGPTPPPPQLPVPPAIVITVIQPQPAPPTVTVTPFSQAELLRFAKELENSMQAGSEMTLQSGDLKIGIKKGTAPHR